MQNPHRLVCIVEGKGDVQAMPDLCARILFSLAASQWVVDKNPIRRPRSQLVDEKTKSPNRPCKQDGVAKALAMAAARHPDAVLVTCDADDDCPGVWAQSIVSAQGRSTPTAAVMAVREFEAWLLWEYDDKDLAKVKASDPERVRDAKGRLQRLVAGYDPIAHQLELTHRIDMQYLRKRSRSFDKLVRTLGVLCKIPVPPRPS